MCKVFSLKSAKLPYRTTIDFCLMRSFDHIVSYLFNYHSFYLITLNFYYPLSLILSALNRFLQLRTAISSLGAALFFMLLYK
jgi:hypothetical protein